MCPRRITTHTVRVATLGCQVHPNRYAPTGEDHEEAGASQRGISGVVGRGPLATGLLAPTPNRKPGAPGVMERKGKGEEHRDC